MSDEGKMPDDPKVEAERAYGKLIEQAERCVRFHREANLDLPNCLRRYLRMPERHSLYHESFQLERMAEKGKP